MTKCHVLVISYVSVPFFVVLSAGPQVNLSFGAFGSSGGGGDGDLNGRGGGGGEDCSTCVLKAIWVPGSQVRNAGGGHVGTV